MNSIMKLLGGFFYCYVWIFLFFPLKCIGCFLNDESEYGYCHNCNEYVTFEKKMKKGLFWVMVILTYGFWLIPYGFYYALIKKPVCPRCGKERMKVDDKKTIVRKQ